MSRLNMRRRLTGVVGGLVLTVPVAASVAVAQTGTVAGTVTDRTNSAPVPSAQIQIVGTTRGVLSGSDGHYRFNALPTGPTQLRITRIGYAAETRTVTVPTADVATVDFTLAPTQVTLDQVVVTGLATTQRERENGSTVATIAVDSVNKAAIGTFSDLVTAKASGVNVTQSSGEVGTGARIRIRGSNSISLSNDPLLVIDGIRVNANANSFSDNFGVNGQTPSRFDDLNPDDIENIEVLKGPAASALYGAAGANGVLLVTTKHGVGGRARWTAHADYGTVANAGTFPSNFGQAGTITGTGAPTNACTLVAQGLGACSATLGGLLVWNPLMSSQFSPFSKNNARDAFGASVAGGSDITKYFVSGDYDYTHGVYPNNFQTKNNGRANVQSQAGSNVDFSLNAGYLQSRTQFPQNDNNVFSPIASGVLGSPINDPVFHGYGFLPPSIANALIVRQDVERFTGGASGNWRPLGWLTINGVAGLDFTDRADHQLFSPGLIPPGFSANQATGQAVSNPFQIWTYTSQITGTAAYNLGSSLHATSSIGTQYTNELTRGTEASGLGLAAGTGSIAGATNQFTATEIGNRQIVTVGYYGQQQFSWRDRLFLTGALRLDDNSTFGQVYKPEYYPSVSASWVVGEEPWFPKGSVVSSLRLRTAFGYSGQHPGFEQAQTFLNAVPYRDPQLGEVGAVTFGGFGNPGLKPERSHELEAGFDAGLFRDRVNLQLTGYAKTTQDALVLVNLAPSVGGITVGVPTSISNRFENLGEVTNRGVEVLLTSTIIEGRNTRLDLTLNGSLNKNKLVTLGPGIAPIRFGLSSITGEFIQRQQSGYALGGFWQQGYTYSDANHDGIIEPSEVTLNPTETFRGNPFPEQLLSINPSFTFLRYFKLSTLFDNRNVAFTFNSTAQFRCSLVNPFTNCRAAFDRHASLKDQAAVVADALGSDAGFIEPTTFWKWRELSLTATAPESWAARMRVQSFSFTLAARNLHTWTKYTGSDPETNFFGSDNFQTTDFFTQPQVRYVTGRFNISF